MQLNSIHPSWNIAQIIAMEEAKEQLNAEQRRKEQNESPANKCYQAQQELLELLQTNFQDLCKEIMQ